MPCYTVLHLLSVNSTEKGNTKNIKFSAFDEHTTPVFRLLNVLSFFRLVNKRNSTNPAIRLVPGAGGIFLSGQLQQNPVDLFG